MFQSFFRYYYRRELGNLVEERRRLAELTEMLEKRLFGPNEDEVDDLADINPPAAASPSEEVRELSRREQDDNLFAINDEQRKRLYEMMVDEGYDHITMECVDLKWSPEKSEEFVRKLIAELQWFESPDGFERMHARGDAGSVISDMIADIIGTAAEAGWSPLQILWQAVLRYSGGPGLRDKRMRPLIDYLLDTLKIADEAAAERRATAPVKNEDKPTASG